MKILPFELKENVFKMLVLYLNTNSIILIRKELNKKVKISPNFFKNLPIVIDITKLSSIENWNNIKELFVSFNFHILGIRGCYGEVFKNIIMKSGLPILSKEKKLICYVNRCQCNNDNIVHLSNNKKTKIIDFPIRSGQKVYAVHSDLIITSNVNPGSEVIADGNVHVYGSMRGRVLAGAKGDITCQIFCLNFFAELISIAGEYLLIDQCSSNLIGYSVRIYIKNGKLNILKLD
ncbi:MAG: septum site-determining protein MinC [Buchnera aphidicola (Meitanaphis elongallis)]